ncbi:MAG: hypothetical protein R3F14_34520 [Polyangiaceae bacterium]
MRARGRWTGTAVSPVLGRFSAAFAAAQGGSVHPMSLEAFAEVTGLVRGVELSRALTKVGAPLHAYVQGSAHWAGRMAREPETAARFDALVREARGRG